MTVTLTITLTTVLTIALTIAVSGSLYGTGLLEDQAGTDSSSLAGVGPGAALWHGGAGAWGPYITSALVAQHLLEDKVDYLVDGDEVRINGQPWSTAYV